ncbi:MAG: Holliday junction resolvase RuvX [Alphaproteobacteria bacterium]|nr:Holliday junction resolvase RuvX [Alphaproteobacteria bacterium]
MPVCNLAELPSFLAGNQCLLGLDYGTAVIGLAISDPLLKVASPLSGLTRKSFTQDVLLLAVLIKERQIGGLVVGLPKNMDGSQGAMAQRVRSFVSNLERKAGGVFETLPVAFWDERLSSVAVERAMIEGDLSRRKRLARVDQAAAAYILQGALDALGHLKGGG